MLVKDKNYNVVKFKENIWWKKEYTKAHDLHFIEQKRLKLTVILKLN